MVVFRDESLHALRKRQNGGVVAEELLVTADSLILRRVHSLAIVQPLDKIVGGNIDCPDAVDPFVARVEEFLLMFLWHDAVVVRRDGVMDVFVLEIPVVRRIFGHHAVAARLVVVNLRNGADDELSAVGRAFDGERMVAFENVAERLKPRRFGGDDGQLAVQRDFQ